MLTLIRNIILLSLLLAMSSQYSNTILAQGVLRVERIAVSLAVEDRQPVGESDVFPDTVRALYCFNEIRGMGDSTSVSHVWYHGDIRRAEVKLNVRGYRWRTWSTKAIQKDWTGDWRVDVVSAEGKILKSKRFRIISTNNSVPLPDTSLN